MSATLNLGTDGNWATKKDTILAYNDENSNFKPLAFNFDRDTLATRVNKDGLIETVGSGEPRIDYKDDSKGALLLEPSRSNLVPYSQDFSNSAWNTSSTRSVDFVPTSTIDPQGKTNAYRITSTASDNQVAIIGSIISGQTYTNSIYVRRVSGSGDVALRNVNNQATNFQVSVDDGWKRIETSVISTSTFGRLYVNLLTVGDVIEIWGAQLESGSYATSYIPTQGSAVTRVADFAEQDLPNDNILIDNNSTIYFEVDTTNLINNTPNTGGFNFKNSGGTTQLNFNYGYGRIYSNYYTGSTTAIIQSAEVGTYKFAFPLTNGSYLYVNGVQKSATSRDWSAISISEIETLFGHSIKDFRIYNEILSNTELQTLTQI